MRRVAVIVVALAALIGVAPTSVGHEMASAAEDPPAAAVPLPEPVRALIAVLGPLAAPACGAVGLAGTLIAQEAGATPAAGEVFKAMTPVFLVCALLPAPDNPTRCSVDAPIDSLVGSLVPALGGLLPLPRPGSQVIDTLAALQVLVLAQSGVPLDPKVDTLLRQLLDCETPAATPPPDDGSTIDLNVPTITPPSSSAPPSTTMEWSAPPVPAPALAGPSTPVAPGRPQAVGVTTAPPSSNTVRLVVAGALFAALAPFAAGRRPRRTSQS